MGWQVEISEKKNINFSSLRSCYHKLANRKKLILQLEKYFKTLNDMIIGTAGTRLLDKFTIFQSGRNNGVKVWEFYRWSNRSELCSSCKNTFLGAGNLQVTTNEFWFENLSGPYVLYLDAVLCIYSFSFLRSWSI